ncbi:transcription termination factor Rho [Nocardioides stalactiti]|uniref:transcription termination factor Rho n=1 Tax=Nocardioides stalactiti TaxID=2755356 RepID=UPI0016032850|nr:transcription termination factor Rho [Nocardioides stalactiti]
MLLADLKAMAGGMGIAGTASMKKAQLVEAIKAAQASTPQQTGAAKNGDQPAKGDAPRREEQPKADRATAEPKAEAQPTVEDQPRGEDRPKGEDQPKGEDRPKGEDQPKGDKPKGGDKSKGGDKPKGEAKQKQDQPQQNQSKQQNQHGQQNQQAKQNQQPAQQGQQGQQGQQDGSDGQDGPAGEGGSRRNRRRRGRDRATTTVGGRNEPDTTILEDDVLVPAAGILDVLDNYAFVRTSGYLAGPDDVYLSLSMVRKYGLRRGDAIVGQVRQPRDGERREKFNPMVRVESVNGVDPEQSRHRVDFAKLTPLYPSERLRLETDPTNMIGRVIDIAAPIGKGQRGLIVSPAKAGKTMVLQQIANSITTNNPECHLMVVLVDERPEEVTDFERSVKGEVISSTFDRPATDHTTVAELAIERAKRLVELGHDVVVLLDGITRLGRAYNLAAPASGRILSGGVDSAALYPPKKFFGAARNIENGGSLTILATALIDSGSKMDEVIFEEFKGTGNMEIRLRRDFADKRLFPAIDVIQSGTRREELLLSKEEMAIIWKLRRVLSALDGQQALEVLLEKLKKSPTNIDFLMQVQKTTPAPGADE